VEGSFVGKANGHDEDDPFGEAADEDTVVALRDQGSGDVVH